MSQRATIKAMDEAELLRQATSLIAIRSTSDQAQELLRAVNYIAEMLAEDGHITIERFERDGKPSLLAYAKGPRPKRFDVLLNGHVDVVPAPSEDLFVARQNNGRLYGRGAVDMKVAALVETAAFRAQVAQANYALGLQIVADEEVGGANGTGYQVEQGVAADFMLAGEFTAPGTICTASRGISWVTIRFSGKTAHGAYPWNGDNAVLQATHCVNTILQDYPLPAKEIWTTTINIASISTPNHTFNQVPAAAELKLDCRYIPNDPHFRDRTTLQHYLHAVAPEAEITIHNFEPSHQADHNNATLHLLTQALEQTDAQPVRYIRKYGAADVRYYSAHDCTAVSVGVNGAGLHGDEEYVEIESISRYYRTLMAFLTEFQKS